MVPINTVQGQGKYLFKEDRGNNRIGRGTPLITNAFDFGIINSVQSVKKDTPDMHYADRILTILLHFNLPFSRSQTGPVIESITLLPLPFSGWSRRICVDRWLIGCFSADVEYGSNDIVAFLQKVFAL